METKFTYKEPKTLIDLDTFYPGMTTLPIEETKLLLQTSPDLGAWLSPTGALTKYGQANVINWLIKYNERVVKHAYDDQVKLFLKEALKNFKPLLDTIHKRKELRFTKILNYTEPNKLLYKSPSYNRRQSSEYRLGLVQEELAYFRKSNHWGIFTVNIDSIPEAMQEFNISEQEALEMQKRDPFGRIGAKRLNWILQGANTRKDGAVSQTSQIGYVLLKDLIA